MTDILLVIHLLSHITAADITDDILPSLTREDLRDLLPGPENFLKRKRIWEAVHPEVRIHSELKSKYTLL